MAEARREAEIVIDPYFAPGFFSRETGARRSA
jgi:hypothetical protein